MQINSLGYKIRFRMPEHYDSGALLRALSSPIARKEMLEIYNYAIEKDGFYFIDHQVDPVISAQALRLFIDAALQASSEVSICRLLPVCGESS